jgi:serine protease Do
MDQFVCVRLVQANRLDLQLFQFDYDLTFAVFFLNADRTLYGRYGSRSSHDDAESDISLSSFGKAMQGALLLHGNYPANKKSLNGKQPKKIKQRTPDDFASLRGKFNLKLDYTGQVTKSCMHCHQIRDAERLEVRSEGQELTDQLLFPYPMPDTIGLKMDPLQRATVTAVAASSLASKASFQKGDVIQSLDGQAILSTADIQWVLHHSKDVDRWNATVLRGGKTKELRVELPQDWRRETDIGWRVSTWELRRMATGGLRLNSLDDSEKTKLGIPTTGLALHAQNVGQYGAHAMARRAGFRKGDVIVQVGDYDTSMSESEFLVRIMQHTKPGKKLPTIVLRDGKRLSLMLPTQ